MTIIRDINRKRGDTYPIEATIYKDDQTPYDLTGVTSIKFGVSETADVPDGSSPAFVLTGSIVDAPAGVASFPMTAVEASLPTGDYFAEIQFVENGLIISTNTMRYTVTGNIIA